HIANENDAAFRPTEIERAVQQTHIAAGCTNDDTVCTGTIGPFGHDRRGLASAAIEAALHAEAARQLDAIRQHVNAQHTSAGSMEQLGGQLPHEPETQNDELLAGGWV